MIPDNDHDDYIDLLEELFEEVKPFSRKELTGTFTWAESEFKDDEL